MKRKLRFTIRALLVLMVLSAIPCWWVTREMSEFQSEKNAFAHIQEVNPRMSAVWENKTPSLMTSIGIQPDWMNRIVRLDATGVTCGKLKWEDYPQAQIEFGDDELKLIADDIEQLQNLHEIYFQVTKLTDESINFFGTLTKLEVLNLQETDITPNGAKVLQNRLVSTSVEHHQASSK